MPILLFLLLLPIMEMWVLIQVGSEIGALPTIGLVMLAAVLGISLLRKQGASVLMRANERMQRGEVPAREMVDGMFLAAGGILLLIPGFITDAFALICLLPGVRHWVLGKALKNVVFQSHAGAHGTVWRKKNGQDGDIIEGEFKRQQTPSEDQKKLPSDR